MREALIASMGADQPSPVRMHGITAVRNLASINTLRWQVWNTEEIQVRLLQAVSIGQPADVRAAALFTLIELSYHDSNAREMVRSGVREILFEAAEDDQLEPVDR